MEKKLFEFIGKWVISSIVFGGIVMAVWPNDLLESLLSLTYGGLIAAMAQALFVHTWQEFQKIMEGEK